jgi:hypothetical protein
MAEEREIPASAADAESGRGRTFAIKAAVTVLAGSLLSLSVAFVQAGYSERMELLDRQSEHGARFQARVLESTGTIENQMMDMLEFLREGSPEGLAEARSILREELESSLSAWRSNVLMLRNRAADIYGRDVARLIYDSNEKFYRVDRCNVVVRLGSESSVDECGPRRGAELRRLDQMLNEITGAAQPDLARSMAIAPANIHTNINLIHYLMVRYLNCAERSDLAQLADTRCQDREVVLRILQKRADRLNILRENLANEMMNAALIDN